MNLPQSLTTWAHFVPLLKLKQQTASSFSALTLIMEHRLVENPNSDTRKVMSYLTGTRNLKVESYLKPACGWIVFHLPSNPELKVVGLCSILSQCGGVVSHLIFIPEWNVVGLCPISSQSVVGLSSI